MVPAPSRIVQIGCALAVVVGFLPWCLMVAFTVLGAIESTSPIAMTIAAWATLLVPVWVAWFATLAWRQRNISARPAVLMALPVLLVTAIVLALPFSSFAP